MRRLSIETCTQWTHIHKPSTRKPSEMANYRMVLDQRWEGEAGSLRSRASSIISTGTKFSFSTLAHEEHHPNIDGVLGRLNSVAGRGRPGSVLSCEEPAPPYEDQDAVELGQVPTATENEIVVRTRSSTPVAEESRRSATTPPSDGENAISTHYTHVVRCLDASHARDLAVLKDTHAQELSLLHASLANADAHIEAIKKEHEQHLAATRNEIDQTYRREFRAVRREAEKNKEEVEQKAATEVQQTKERAAAEFDKLKEDHQKTIVSRLKEEHEREKAWLREEHEMEIVKARNAVEDVWEARWRDRIRVAAEEVERVERGSKERLEKAAERVKELATRHPEILRDSESIIEDLEGI